MDSRKENKIKASAIVNYILKYCNDHRILDITNMKMQKLLYYCYGYHLYKHTEDAESLFCDDIDFWQHGAVVPNIYHALKHFKSDVICDYIQESFDGDSYYKSVLPVDMTQEKKEKIIQCIVYIMKKLGRYDAFQLRDINHRRDYAWHNVYQGAWHDVYPEAKSLTNDMINDMIIAEIKSLEKIGWK